MGTSSRLSANPFCSIFTVRPAPHAVSLRWRRENGPVSGGTLFFFFVPGRWRRLPRCILRPEQLDTMVAAIHLNRAMQEKNADLKYLLDQWETLLKKVRYTSGYVPAPYLFCSGSIYGLKEYTGFLRSDDISQKALNKQRELILQKIIENTQQTINLLIEDVNFVAERLEKAIQNSDELHQNYLYILDRFRQGITRLHQTEQATQEELDQSRAAQADQEENHEQEE